MDIKEIKRNWIGKSVGLVFIEIDQPRKIDDLHSPDNIFGGVLMGDCTEHISNHIYQTAGKRNQEDLPKKRSSSLTRKECGVNSKGALRAASICFREIDHDGLIRFCKLTELVRMAGSKCDQRDWICTIKCNSCG